MLQKRRDVSRHRAVVRWLCPRTHLHRLGDSRIDVLFSTDTGVNHFARLVEHHHVTGCWGVVGAAHLTFAIVEHRAREFVDFLPPVYPIERLIHGHRNSDELHGGAVFFHRSPHGRLHLFAVAAPRGPKFQHDWSLADVAGEFDGLAVECFQWTAGTMFAERDADVLRLGRRDDGCRH